MDVEDKRVLFLGDSITQAGQYVGFVEYALRKQSPQERYDFYSLGLDSETVSGLSEHDHPFPRPNIHERLSRALAEIKPDLIFVCYGMNDGIYHPLNEDILEAFRSGYVSLIEKCQATDAELVVITPPSFQAYAIPEKLGPLGAEDYSYLYPYENYHQTLEAFSEFLKIALPEDVVCIDLNTRMTEFLNEIRKENKDFYFSKDGIHPSLAGHLFIAEEVMKGLSRGSALLRSEALNDVKKDPLYQMIEKRRQLRSRGWLKYIGYTRNKVFKTDSIVETEARCTGLLKEIENLNTN
ncbi:SGNH/GDSL hydrolase family protein [Lentisphaera profundi]|uniref:SGNH/GDSL hydrolase family protein n=1 Tax=Lentisphaera profundi TaxID=1658616 RepID=A0ABY7VVR5_9BACT|nr:SGNH/GDSL hydrolase family protein [Lentisphaera profundi]WDE98331.1 SGNH/GDSL hydrolase family protein [Lentisphaera profundi]